MLRSPKAECFDDRNDQCLQPVSALARPLRWRDAAVLLRSSDFVPS